MPPSLLSLPRTSPESSTCSTPRAVSLPLAPTELQTAPSTYSKEDLRDNYRGPYSSDSDYPSVRVTAIDVEEKSSPPSLKDFDDRMVSTFRSRSKSPGPSVNRDEGDLRPQTSDHPLSHSWWNEEKHVVRPKKKSEQTEALQSTRNVSNNNAIARGVSS